MFNTTSSPLKGITAQEIPGLIAGCAVGFFYTGELFYCMPGLGVSVSFVSVLCGGVFGGGTFTLLTTG